MKFWHYAAALLTVFHAETTKTWNNSTPKDVKNEGRPGYVYENTGANDIMSERTSDICARLKRFLQEIGVTSSQNTSKARSADCRLCGPRPFSTPRRNRSDWRAAHTPGFMCTTRAGWRRKRRGPQRRRSALPTTRSLRIASQPRCGGEMSLLIPGAAAAVKH